VLITVHNTVQDSVHIGVPAIVLLGDTDMVLVRPMVLVMDMDMVVPEDMPLSVQQSQLMALPHGLK